MSQQLPSSWYYMQVFFEDPDKGFICERFVVMADNKADARDKSMLYIRRNFPGKNIKHDHRGPQLYFYKNNYKPESRRLISEGKVI